MQDNELFELCKSVYDKTGWGKDEEFDNYVLELGFKPQAYAQWQIPELWQNEMGWADDAQWPLYTSDYLLENLPGFIEQKGHLDGIDRQRRVALGLRKWDYQGAKYHAEYHEMYHIPLFRTEADTPLKALLRLTLALHEAGELPTSNDGEVIKKKDGDAGPTSL